MARPASDPIRVLLSTYLFQDLSPAELAPLVKAVGWRRYQRREYIFQAGDPADFLHVVATGQVKYFSTTPDGNEFVHEILTPGGVFGEPGLFATERTRVVDAMAMELSDVVFVHRERFIDFLMGHRPAMMRMLTSLAGEARQSVETVTDLAFVEIRTRIAHKLLELAGTHGQERGDGSIKITLTMSQETVAGFVGASRERVNRALGAMTRDGDVEVVEGHFVIPDPALLRSRLSPDWAPLYRRNRLAEDLARD